MYATVAIVIINLLYLSDEKKNRLSGIHWLMSLHSSGSQVEYILNFSTDYPGEYVYCI